MNFDRLAPHYRWMERILAGEILQRARTRWLDALSDRSHLLIIGEGAGRALEVICERFPALHVTVVEASAQMIAAAKAHLEQREFPLEKITWVHADVRIWLADRPVEPGNCDAVLTPFVLDCFAPDDVRTVIAGIAASTARNCTWLLSDFRLPEGGWRRSRGRVVHALMYGFFRVATKLEARRVTPPDDALRAGGFALAERRLFNAGLIHSDLWRRE